MDDYTPRNVVVGQQLQTPFLVDFAQCDFREEMVRMWEEVGWTDEEGWDSDSSTSIGRP